MIFFVIYAVVWAIQYLAWMRSVQAINRKLQDR